MGRPQSGLELPQQRLYHRRYLIVMDDMWSKKAWDDVRMLFPDSGNSSWIIVTTRLHDVAAYVDSSSSIHTMSVLDAHHSWNLLEQKVFAGTYFPIELKDIGKKIVQNCGGLPLSIVVVAELLSKVYTRSSWEQIAANDEQLESIIGFVTLSNGSKSLEEEAEDCFEDLVERSLVLVANRKFDGKIKSCSLHDIVREFCVRQAAKEKALSLARDLVYSKRMVEMIPNIKKLGICYSKEKFDANAGYCLDNLNLFCQLEKLKLEMSGGFLSRQLVETGGIKFPLQLRRLTLIGGKLPWNEMTIIGSLPNLQVLKLRNYACKGTYWMTIEGNFRELRFLLIDRSGLVDWITEASHFPSFEFVG
ncbi:putative late blight resistance protein homolog R1A-3 [Salvia miltiorrhiza]|uniref:putative late blight resistance protein homolog R1A-3 n=1 Tax=Salvia miltiorrhiza TaxID=226208 RepID=UPI0025ABEB64|nr:putative late blight resistance protein homolog R1A-3 [Salvia miltiorrhiza]